MTQALHHPYRGIDLPISVPTISQWQFSDYRMLQLTAVADAGGTSTLYGPSIPDDQRWLVEHALTANDGAAAPVVRWYLDYVSNSNLLEGTSAGAFNTGDWPAGLFLPSGRQLIVLFTGATPGSNSFFNAQVRILQRTVMG